MNKLTSTYDLNDPELVSAFDELSLWSAPFGLKLLDTVVYRNKLTVLDIGFGTGFPLLELAMRLGHSCKVFGIDPWKAAIERTKMKMKIYGIENVTLIEGDAESIPLADDSVDLLVSNNGLNNVDDLDKVLSECERVTKKGAQFVMTMNLDKTMIEFYTVMENVLKEKGMDTEIHKMKEHIYSKRKPIAEITARMEQHSFQVAEIREDRFNYRFTDGTIMLSYYFIRLAFLDSWKKIVPEDKVREVFSEIEMRLNAKALKEGMLELQVPFAVINAQKTERKS